MNEFKEFCNELLDVLDERGGSYGEPEDSFRRICLFWTAYLNIIVSEQDVANMMILLKLAREAEVHKDDNYLDIAGYAACATLINKKED